MNLTRHIFKRNYLNGEFVYLNYYFYSFPTSSHLCSQLYTLSTFSEKMLTFRLLKCVCVYVRVLEYVCERVCVYMYVCVRCGLYLICCLRNTITFLLSDRVSRHTRDRARQCALETGDGARAPKPSASFTDREPFTPLEITRRLCFLPHSDTETSCGVIRAWIISFWRDSAAKIGYEARCVDVTRGSLSLSLSGFKLNSAWRFSPGFCSLALRMRFIAASRPHHLQTRGHI